MIIDGTNGLTFNNSTTQASAGVVLQVVQGTYSTQVSSSSSTYADTGLTATITPKFATSKILVSVVHTACNKSNSDTFLTLRLLRGASSIAVFETAGGYTGNASPIYFGACGIDYLDSPATTSSCTYKVRYKANTAGTVYFNNYITTNGNTGSTITLMEIAG